MLLENKNPVLVRVGWTVVGTPLWDERTVVANFAAKINALGPLDQALLAVQARILAEVQTVARRIDVSSEAGIVSGYDRRVLHEDPDNWSLAAIILRPGQHTHPHDHGGWGCAVTVQGIERDRRFSHDAAENLLPISEQDYPPGSGYVFDPVAVHQPIGVDPHQITVSLHFLVHETYSHRANRVLEFPQQVHEKAA